MSSTPPSTPFAHRPTYAQHNAALLNEVHQQRHCCEILWHKSSLVVGGVDEVGRGALAGPVVAAAVILDMNLYTSLSAEQQQLIGDSKQKSPQQRKRGYQLIKSIARSYAIQGVREHIIDQIGIHQASLLAMSKAAHQLSLTQQTRHKCLDVLIVDGSFRLPQISSALAKYQLAIQQADATFKVVGAASILAKVYRDTLMSRLGLIFEHYQKYSFAAHKGYPTAYHQQALAHHGVSPIHRQSYRTVAQHLSY